VFCSSTSTPLDHTSIKATLRDWLGLAHTFKQQLPSPRIATAATITPVFTESSPQVWPIIKYAQQQAAATSLFSEKVNAPAGPPPPAAGVPSVSGAAPAAAGAAVSDHALSDLHQALYVSAAAAKRGAPYTHQEKLEAFKQLHTHRDAHHWRSTHK